MGTYNYPHAVLPINRDDEFNVLGMMIVDGEEWDGSTYCVPIDIPVPSNDSSQQTIIYGQGTSNPIGLSLSELSFAYWRVKKWSYTQGAFTSQYNSTINIDDQAFDIYPGRNFGDFKTIHNYSESTPDEHTVICTAGDTSSYNDIGGNRRKIREESVLIRQHSEAWGTYNDGIPFPDIGSDTIPPATYLNHFTTSEVDVDIAFIPSNASCTVWFTLFGWNPHESTGLPADYVVSNYLIADYPPPVVIKGTDGLYYPRIIFYTEFFDFANNVPGDEGQTCQGCTDEQSLGPFYTKIYSSIRTKYDSMNDFVYDTPTDLGTIKFTFMGYDINLYGYYKNLHVGEANAPVDASLPTQGDFTLDPSEDWDGTTL